MAKGTVYTCDICGKHKQAVNHWYLSASVVGFTLQRWSDEIADCEGIKHYCGQECSLKATAKWMQIESEQVKGS